MTLAIPLQILVRVHDDPASVSIASLAVEGAVEGDRPADSAVMTAIALARQNRNLPPHRYYDDQADSADRTASLRAHRWRRRSRSVVQRSQCAGH